MCIVDGRWLLILIMTIDTALDENVTLFRIPVDDRCLDAVSGVRGMKSDDLLIDGLVPV